MQDLLTVLDAQRSQLNAEDGLVQSQLARYTATVSLFKALGGGWEASGT
jgi:outer membrane protein TolC